MGWLSSAASSARIQKNFVTDYGAVNNGTDANTTPMRTFTAFAAGQNAPVTLTIPAGNYFLPGGRPTFLEDIDNILVNGAGATITSGMWIGGFGEYEDDAHHALINTVSAGSSAVVVNDGNVSRFAVGDWICVACLDTQGFGFPANPALMEFKKIDSISGTTVNFSSPLVNSYKSTYPQRTPTPGNNFFPGAASILKMEPAWNTTVTINDLTVDQSSGVYGSGRQITLNNCNFPNYAPAPTLSRLYTLNNCVFSGYQVETDKMTDEVRYNNCTAPLGISFQSASVQRAYILGGSADSINGTPRSITIDGATIGSLIVGANYGATESVTVRNSSAITLSKNLPALLMSEFTNSAGVTMAPGVAIADGIIRYSMANLFLTWAVPGACFYLSDNGRILNYGCTTQITDVTTDGSNYILHLNRTTPYPAADAGTSPAPYQLICYPTRSFTGLNNTGAVELTSMNGQTGELFGRLVLSHTSTAGGTPTQRLWGALTEVRVNVTRAYTGAQGSCTMNVNGEFGNTCLAPNLLTRQTWNPVINLKVAGERVITPTTVTGAQSGDTLGSAPGLIWFTGPMNQLFNHDTSGDTAGQQALVTISFVTSQGVG